MRLENPDLKNEIEILSKILPWQICLNASLGIDPRRRTIGFPHVTAPSDRHKKTCTFCKRTCKF
jgi:hypothetical protein